MSFDRLLKQIEEKQNPTVVGLDPVLDYIPEHIKTECFSQYGETLEGAAQAFLQFNKGIIDAVADVAPAIKPQIAFYEALGYEGIKTYIKTVEYAKEKGLYVIIDAKRGDIGSTMEAYAAAHLGKTEVGSKNYEAFGGDALTVNALFGIDGVQPLLERCREYDKGIFILAKTSNPSSGQLQDRKIDGETVYRILGDWCEDWGKELPGAYGYSAVGAVVGATYPEQLKELRKALPHTFFLVPGYGAQGGGAKDVKDAFDEKGLGAVINASRSILCAWKKDGDGKNYGQAARTEALRMKADLLSVIGKITL